MGVPSRYCVCGKHFSIGPTTPSSVTVTVAKEREVHVTDVVSSDFGILFYSFLLELQHSSLMSSAVRGTRSVNYV